VSKILSWIGDFWMIDDNYKDMEMHMEAYLPVSLLGNRLNNGTNQIDEAAAHIAETTCVNWRPRTNDDLYFVNFTGNTFG
jgi:hypothetical protein